MSTSRSVNFAPSMRVDAPTDSTVATRRSVARRSGARLPNAFQAPLNSSISPTSRRRSEVSTRFFRGSRRISENIPANTQMHNRVFAGIFAGTGYPHGEELNGTNVQLLEHEETTIRDRNPVTLDRSNWKLIVFCGMVVAVVFGVHQAFEEH